MTKGKDISVDYLRTRLRYEPETGKLFWLDNEDMPKKWRSRFAGKEAFTTNMNGYRVSSILDTPFLAHRVCWALHFGEWPSKCIDHINGVKDDNRIENLRNVSHRENMKNQKRDRRNKSGVSGVHWYRQRNKWVAYVKDNNKPLHLGYFDCVGQAIKVRREAEKLYGFHENHGRR